MSPPCEVVTDGRLWWRSWLRAVTTFRRLADWRHLVPPSDTARRRSDRSTSKRGDFVRIVFEREDAIREQAAFRWLAAQVREWAVLPERVGDRQSAFLTY